MVNDVGSLASVVQSISMVLLPLIEALVGAVILRAETSAGTARRNPKVAVRIFEYMVVLK